MTGVPADLMDGLARDYGALRGGTLREFGLPSLDVGCITVSCDRCDDAESATRQAFEYEQSCVGWSRRASWAGRTPRDAPADAGPPLDGEWVTSETASVRLFYDGRTWRFITITETESGEHPVLKEKVELLAGRRGDDAAGRASALCYTVYWGVPDSDASGIRRLACRFLGFDEAARKG